MSEELVNFDTYEPLLDTFLDFKNRISKKVEKLPEFSQKVPDFKGFFKRIILSLGLELNEESSITNENHLPSEGQVLDYIRHVIAATQALQDFHEMIISVPDYFTTLLRTTSNVWVKLATEFLMYCVKAPAIKNVENQEKYYIVVPLIERIMSMHAPTGGANENAGGLSMEHITLLILIYKTYTTSLQKNKFMDDVEDLFVLFVGNLFIFDFNNWKNPLLDNYHRMLVQVGLMLRRDDVVSEIVKWRRKYFDAIKENLIHDAQDQNVLLNVINVQFSIAKNYLQLSDVNAHEGILKESDDWLDSLMEKNPSFSKKAWKLKVKMIRSLGHNALKRGNKKECYQCYLKALVLSHHHKLQREYDRAMMYVEKYSRFFLPDHVPALKADLSVMPDRLSRTHLLYLIGRIFTQKHQYYDAIHVQRLLVDILEEAYNDAQLKLAISNPTPDMVASEAHLQELLSNNLDYLGNMLVRARQVDEGMKVFEKEAALFTSPKKQVKVYTKIAKENFKNNRYKEAIEFGEKAYRIIAEHNLVESREKILEFLIDACKFGDQTSKLSDYKKLLYNK
nr:hypothetical protein [Candidatus Sigynarchaeota archaeon]